MIFCVAKSSRSQPYIVFCSLVYAQVLLSPITWQTCVIFVSGFVVSSISCRNTSGALFKEAVFDPQPLSAEIAINARVFVFICVFAPPGRSYVLMYRWFDAIS